MKCALEISLVKHAILVDRSGHVTPTRLIAFHPPRRPYDDGYVRHQLTPPTERFEIHAQHYQP